MKFTTAYYLMLIYLTVICKPLIPVICDAVDHSFSDAIHIATIHAKYGNNHVALQIAELEKENSSPGNSHSVKLLQTEAEHLSNFEVYMIEQPVVTFVLFNLHVPVFYDNWSIASPLPPPKFI